MANTPAPVQITNTNQLPVYKTKGFWIVTALVILLIIVGIYFYKRGKSQVTLAPLPANDSVGNNMTDDQLKALAATIRNELKGVNWGTDHDETVYTPVLAMGSYDFVRLNNAYNTQYQTDDKSFFNKINDSWSLPLTEWSATKSALLAKLGANGITK